MQRILSLDQTPSLSVPLRFFLSAPLFLLAAGLLLWWEGPEALVSRWSPATLYLLWRRKRPKADATTLFWRTAMASLLACAALWIVRPAVDLVSGSLTLGVLFIIGFAFSAINGMLYKIVPFLLWYHAQSAAAPGSRNVPSIKQILPDSVAVKQFCAHLLALMLLAAASIFPEWTRYAACALCISAAWLQINLLNALRIYWRAQRLPASAFVSA